MSGEQRIRNLEDAVLQLTRAINLLIGEQRIMQAHVYSDQDKFTADFRRTSAESIANAQKAIEAALNLVALEDHV